MRGKEGWQKTRGGRRLKTAASGTDVGWWAARGRREQLCRDGGSGLKWGFLGGEECKLGWEALLFFFKWRYN